MLGQPNGKTLKRMNLKSRQKAMQLGSKYTAKTLSTIYRAMAGSTPKKISVKKLPGVFKIIFGQNLRSANKDILIY